MTQSERNLYPIAPGSRRGDVASVRGGGGEYPATVMLAGHACTYGVRAGRTEAGESVLLSLRVDPLEGNTITKGDLSVIPTQRLASAAVWAGAIWPGDDHGPDEGETEVDWSRFSQPEQGRKAGRPVERGPEHFGKVAKLARAAWSEPAAMSARDVIANPGHELHRGLVERLGLDCDWLVNSQTADKWIRQAQRLGLLESYAVVRSRVGGGAPTDSAAGEVAP